MRPEERRPNGDSNARFHKRPRRDNGCHPNRRGNQGPPRRDGNNNDYYQPQPNRHDGENQHGGQRPYRGRGPASRSTPFLNASPCPRDGPPYYYGRDTQNRHGRGGFGGRGGGGGGRVGSGRGRGHEQEPRLHTSPQDDFTNVQRLANTNTTHSETTKKTTAQVLPMAHQSDEQVTSHNDKSDAEQELTLYVGEKLIPNEERVRRLCEILPEESDVWKRLLFFDTSHPSWIEKEARQKAVASTMEWLKEEQKKPKSVLGLATQDDVMDDDDSDEDSADPRVDMSRTTESKNKTVESIPATHIQFLQSLPTFEPLTATFFVLPLLSHDVEWNYCPCSQKCRFWRHGQVWRKEGHLEPHQREDCPVDFTACSQGGKFGPFGIVQHLREKEDRYHRIAYHYITAFLANFHGTRMGHKQLYHLNSKKFREASSSEVRTIHRYMEKLVAENSHLRRREARLMQEVTNIVKVNEDKAKRLLCEIKDMNKLRTYLGLSEEEESREISPEELKLYQERRDLIIKSLKNIQGMKNLSQTEGIKIKVQQRFKLDDVVEAVPELSEPLHCMGEAAKWLKCWEVQFDIHAELALKRNSKRNKQALKEMQVTDAGGPTRSFLSQIWRKIPTLTVSVGDRKVQLWYRDNSSGFLFPQPDTVVLSALVGIEKEGTNSADYARRLKEALKKVRSTARFVGRLVFYCMVNKCEYDGEESQYFHVDESLLPDVYLQYLFRGVQPTDKEYVSGMSRPHNEYYTRANTQRQRRDNPRVYLQPLGDLVNFLLQCKFGLAKRQREGKQSEIELDREEQTRDVLQKLHHYIYADEYDATTIEDKPWNELRADIRSAIKRDYIDDRQIVLKAFKEGLALDASLEESGMLPSDLLWASMPVQAIKALLLCKSNCSVEELISCLRPKYCEQFLGAEGDMNHVPGEYQQAQKRILSKHDEVTGLLPDLLRELDQSESEQRFTPADFLEFVTGTRFVPYDGTFFATVEFSAFDVEFLPRSHTCSKEVVLPLWAYYGESVNEQKQTLKKKLLLSLSYNCGIDSDALDGE